LSAQISDQELSRAADVPAEWAAAKDASAAQASAPRPWRWSVTVKPFFWPDAAQAELKALPKCGDYKLEPSDGVFEAAVAALNAIGVDAFSTLHLRRGDALADCDTSVAKVAEYMRCDFTQRSQEGVKLPNAAWDAPGDEALVVFTDETDPAYLQEVIAELSKIPRWGGGVTHGDAVVAAQLSSEDQRDNYLVYAIAREVMRSASNTYAMDRATCGNCVSGGPGGADDDE
jgi:hypothetical protein